MRGRNYPSNLCDLSKEEQDAIEKDKRLWYECYIAVRKLSISQIKKDIEKCECEVEREDMRRRVNICYKNMKQGYKFD